MGDLLSQKRIYDILPPRLYYDALTRGNKLQRFWHDQKFESVLDKIDMTRTKYVMDAGCGPGVLLSRIFKKVFLAAGMDISKNQVKFTNDLLKNNSNVVAACQNIPIKDSSLDCVFIVEVLEHLPSEDADKALESIYRTLKRRGVLVLTTPNYRSLWPVIEFFWNKINPVNYNEQHINKQDIKKLRQALMKVGFKDIKIETVFIISPLVALLSKNAAKRVMTIEKRIFPSVGSLIILKAGK